MNNSKNLRRKLEAFFVSLVVYFLLPALWGGLTFWILSIAPREHWGEFWWYLLVPLACGVFFNVVGHRERLGLQEKRADELAIRERNRELEEEERKNNLKLVEKQKRLEKKRADELAIQERNRELQKVKKRLTALRDAEAEREKVAPCIDWAKTFGIELDTEQARAVSASEEENILVTARAGSGKTRVLTTRALWLIDKLEVPSSEILLVAFNRKAATEMKERLKVHLGQNIPHVMTFHAFAYAIVKPKEKLIYDNKETDYFELTEKVANIAQGNSLSKIVKGLTEKGAIAESILKLKTAPFDDVWYQNKEGKIDFSEEGDSETTSWVKQKPLVVETPKTTFDGNKVKSFGELVVGNCLFENNISYKYEKVFIWDENPYRPDFTIITGEDSGVVIEYFGLKTSEYRKQIIRKRNYWSEKDNWELVELLPEHMKNGKKIFSDYLVKILTDLGVPNRPLTREEIVKKMSPRIQKDDLLEAYTSFITRCRGLGMTHKDLLNEISKHKSEDLEEKEFLNVVQQIYKAYVEEVIGEEFEDFNGLLWKAAEKISQEESSFSRKNDAQLGDVKNFQHVLIDEFQDFSEPFNQLLQDSKRINSSFKTFAVGDNWQAINGFAGSKLEFFNDFHNFFKQPLKLELRKNYRSAEPVVAVSNALMVGTSPRSNALSGVAVNTQRGEARLWDLKELVLTPQEEIIHGTDKLTAALIRLIKQHFDKSRDVVLLSRANNVRNYSRISAYSQKVLSYFPAAQSNSLSFSTTHRYKGLEALAVIIIDAERYPLIHPNWKFQRIFGDNKHQITEEERRLFYVALTRAETVLDVVTKDLEESIFLEDIHEGLTKFEWDTLPEFEYPDSGMLTVRVSNAFYVREILKERGWRFIPVEEYWYKRTSESELEDFNRLERQDWFKHPVKVEVFSEKGEIVWEKEALE